jgi:hypothetical protein
MGVRGTPRDTNREELSPVNDHQLATEAAGRCTLHPAFDADYCPSCGTARPVGMTTAEVVDYSRADAVPFVVAEIREAFGENAESRESFASDPGGWLAYAGMFAGVPDEIVADAIDHVLSGWGFAR